MIFSRAYHKLPDIKLLKLACEGNHKAFDVLLSRYQDGIYRFAWRMSGSQEDAEDIAQECFLRLYVHAARIDPAIGIKPYLYRMARNLCIDSMRKHRPETMDTETVIAEDVVSPLNQVARKESAGAVMDAIRTLPHKQRDAVLLKHGEGLSYNEITEVLGLTTGAVESLLVRARKNLRTRLTPASDEILQGFSL